LQIPSQMNGGNLNNLRRENINNRKTKLMSLKHTARTNYYRLVYTSQMNKLGKRSRR